MSWIDFFSGGLIIGTAASLLLLSTGRVMGASGIVFGALFNATSNEKLWRWLFLIGMLIGGFAVLQWNPELFQQAQTPLWKITVAGLLVGFGTRMGAGCTSGHGICGISRLSPRSIIATCVFVVVAVLTYSLSKHIA